MEPRRAIFVDRDGVLIENRHEYVRKFEHIQIFEQALEACRAIAESPYVAVVVTNQSAVGRGILSLARVRALNRRILRIFEKAGGKIDGVYICPHAPEDDCDCRKPRPGMLLDAAKELNLDLAGSYMIGDALSDMDAARAAGVKGILVRTGRGEAQLKLASPGQVDVVADDLLAAVHMILERKV